MKNKAIYLILFSLIISVLSCEKVEERVYLAENIAPSVILSAPELDLKRANADDSLTLIVSSLDAGFQSSVDYTLMIKKAGVETDKESSITGFQDTILRLSVEQWNTKLKSKAPEFETAGVDFRIRATLDQDAGEGADVYVYYSDPVTIQVTRYGDPRLDLIDSGSEQSIESADEGGYKGLVNLLVSNPFTLYNPETGITYGGSNGTLSVDGAAIVPPFDSEYELTVDLDAMTYGLVRVSAAVMTVQGGESDQVINSPLGDGVYTGMVYMDPAMPVTFLEDDTDNTYGGSDGTLILDGAGIDLPDAGWYELTVDVTAMTYTFDPYQIGVVGAFTNWGTDPDIPMDYDPAEGVWTVTVDLPLGPMKFRLNSDWALNWGPGVAPDTDVDLPANGKMELLNEWGNINIVTAGTYYIELTVDGTAGSVEFTLQ